VARASNVAKQRHPIRSPAQLLVEAGFLAHRDREQAGAQLRVERLAEGVVLRQGERRNELSEAERVCGNGETSRCRVGPDRTTIQASTDQRGRAP
jgi:hypothetical protein